MSEKILEKLAEIQAACSELAANQKNNYLAIQEQGKTLKSQAEILLRNTITVEQHERRSTMIENELKAFQEEMRPVKDHVQQLQGAGQLVRWIGYTIGSILAVIGLFSALKNFF